MTRKFLGKATVLMALATTALGVTAGTAGAISPATAKQSQIDANTPCVGLSGAPSRSNT